ncbi:MAG: hypothetical protein ISS25_03635 [Nanoarchaeota archaeon]|nr:hypothetical protein [DPANN group archaeon]MBL7116894.1 hypothetical protein [Nanoarchaeota archaeon]
MNFYVDTCIYLNLWKKETRQGKPFWKYANDFFEKVKVSKNIVYYSGFVLKELTYKLTEEEFKEKTRLFRSKNYKRIFPSDKDLKLASKIESMTKFEISYYDILHFILSKNTNAILVTRDKKLIRFARKNFVNAKRPEEL